MKRIFNSIKRRYLELIGFLLVTSFVLLLRAFGWLQPLSLHVFDLQSIFWANAAPSQEIVIVGRSTSENLS
jgi:CHASE2 domain-containing sensor protein